MEGNDVVQRCQFFAIFGAIYVVSVFVRFVKNAVAPSKISRTMRSLILYFFNIIYS